MTIEIGICQNPDSFWEKEKKQHNDSCKNWDKIKNPSYKSSENPISRIPNSIIICGTCSFWKKVAEMKQSKIV